MVGGFESADRVLFADSIRKTYGRRAALHGLSFSLAAGRILGFLGPNGAGKTTAIRILTTILSPDSGYFAIAGIGSDRPAQIRERIGVLPESMGFPKGTTAFDYMVFYGRLYGLDRQRATARAKTLLTEVGLADRAHTAIGGYSRGMRQRLGIARSLVNDPPVVFLDEPTLGLDPRGQQELLTMIRGIARERNVAVVLCSHALVEVENICDEVMILNHGDVIAAGPVPDVIGGVGQATSRNDIRRVRVAPAMVDTATTLLENLPALASVAAMTERDGWIRVELAQASPDGDGLVNNEILGALIRESVPVLGFEANAGRLEDIFLQLTQEATA